MAIDKAALLAASFGVEDVEIPGVGVVQVRGLTRAEALKINGKELPVEEVERYLVATAMVDPKLTEDEVKEWQENSPAGHIQIVSEVVERLSGMRREAPKNAMKDFRS